MKSSKLLAASIALVLLLASCSLIPPIPLGADALGYQSEEVSVDDGTVPAGFETLAVDLDGSAGPFFFDNLDPDMTLAPTTFKSVQGFAGTVSVTGTDVPAAITINSGTLTVTVSDDEAGAPDPVVAEVDFGPFGLSRSDTCTGTCPYTFDDPDAAAQSLTLTLNGSDMSRLISIITDHGGNIVTLHLEANVEQDPTDAITFTINVVENHIGF